MSKSNSPWIAQLHFDNAKSLTWVAVIANFILFLGYFFFLTTKVFTDNHAVYCFVTAIIFLGLCLRYTWKNPEFNLLILGLYLLSIAAEFYFIGLASNPLGFSEQLSMSKGIALEIGVSLLPTIYFVIRIFAAVPLAIVYFKAKRLENVMTKPLG